MNTWLKKIIGDKREWKAMEARANVLPRDYRVVYDEGKKYLFLFTADDGMDIVRVLSRLLGLFENSAASGKRAIDVTGKDVAAFYDHELQSAKVQPYDWRRGLSTTLNRKVAQKLAA
jgi:DNA-binding ferritin-like protein (Dps family)